MALFKKGSYNRILTLAGLFLLATGILLIILMFLLQFEDLWRWYDITQVKLANLETRISEIPQKGLFIAAVLSLFFLKVIVPIYPTSTVCFLSAVVLPLYLAIPVNIAGLCIMFTCKYFWGFRFGGGMAWRMVSKVDRLRRLIQRDGNGNPWLLVMLRLVPGTPLNAVSSIYGSMNFGYRSFVLLSVAGFLPRLVSYTIVGRNVYDPLSISFLLPLTILFMLTGVTMLSVNGGIVLIERVVKATQNNKKGEIQNDNA